MLRLLLALVVVLAVGAPVLAQEKVVPLPEESEVTADDTLIRDIQRALQDAGCNPGPADGIWGRRSKAALSNWASTINVMPGGLDLTPRLLNRIRTLGIRCT
jgi:hypothetical protein